MIKGLVSVIIPTYKGAHSLPRAINSVLSQTYRNYEIIVVDDNDPSSLHRNETENVMSKYLNDVNILYIKHNANLNGAVARNSGIKVAKGEYICFLDDDDLMMPYRIEKSIKALIENDKYDAVFVGVAITENGELKEIRTVKESGNCQISLFANVGLFGTGSNLFMRTNAVKDISGFDESFIRHQDVEFMLRFYNEHLSCSIGEVLLIKATNGVNNQPSFNKYLEVKKQFFSAMKPILMNIPEEERNRIIKSHCDEVFTLAHGELSIGNMIALMKKMQPYRPLSVKEMVRAILYSIHFGDKPIYCGRKNGSSNREEFDEVLKKEIEDAVREEIE